jgi:hypothetical protein
LLEQETGVETKAYRGLKAGVDVIGATGDATPACCMKPLYRSRVNAVASFVGTPKLCLSRQISGKLKKLARKKCRAAEETASLKSSQKERPRAIEHRQSSVIDLVANDG